ncbi:SUR7/PalI family-domain-containing protein [Tricharina praecox]|uniref:SUR7/PalI family-domain-containing protein n=1 Tax=Tricharina praecox TaxID=43433 RepID=UPI0022204583|nr:SUR7/PalI family-domain-containing protein [Tricharina praecox]KAI5857112.1 SUR7/PalI family-domain-containing protein [Tricharina praecox]
MFDFGWRNKGTLTTLREKTPPSTPLSSSVTPPGTSPPPSASLDDAAAITASSTSRKPRCRDPYVIIAQSSTLLAIIFQLIVFLGNIRNTNALTDIYFLKIDVSQVIPRSYPNAVLVNSIAQTLGLRGFYQVGLWNYCEGYQGEGVTYCGSPKALYSFDPVTILLSQLLEGATIAIPADISDALDMARKASHWMFASFFVGISFLLVSFLIGWLGHLTRRTAFTVTLISVIAGLFTTIGAGLSTILYSQFQGVFESSPEFNIRANMGQQMYAFVWLAAGFAILAAVVNVWACWRGWICRRLAWCRGKCVSVLGKARSMRR